MVFLCHSTLDKPFVRELTASLIESRVHVWLDSTEIKVGDSLIDKIEQGLVSMDFLAVVLTPNSVNSAWCREELKVALGKQIKERRTVVLPILVADCEIPPFLLDKKFADFRNNFELGLYELLTAINSSIDLSSAKGESKDFKTDMAFDYGLLEYSEDRNDDRLQMHLDVVSFSKHFEHSVLCRVDILGNDRITTRFKQYKQGGFEDIGAAVILGMIADAVNEDKNYIMVDGGKQAETKFTITDRSTGIRLDIKLTARRLGEPVEHIVFHWGTTFDGAFKSIHEKAKKLNPGEYAKLRNILLTPF
jgi:hypothetical protein